MPDRLQPHLHHLAWPGPAGEVTLTITHTKTFFGRAHVIDIAQLRPGTVLVDDSFPHCFDVPAAIARMQRHGDVLVIGGGLLQLPACERELALPLPQPELQQALTRVSLPACLPGCQLESLLLAAYPELPETLGLVEPDGFLVLCSCSHAADLARFREASLRGAARAGRTAQILHVGGAGADHPVHPDLAETSYLKVLFLRLGT